MIDRLLVKPEIEHRLEMSVGLAMKLAGGLVQVAVVGGEEQLYSEKLACPDCCIKRAATRTAFVFVQQYVWCVSRMPWAG